MMNNIAYQITGLKKESFASLFSLNEEELAKRKARRCVVDANPGFPCRVSLEDAEIGETVILLPYIHQEADGPYRSLGPIFVREGAKQAMLGENKIPQILVDRLLSLRGYDDRDMMITTRVVQGASIDETIKALFADSRVAYLHIHNAGPGCFNCRVDRVT